MKNLVNQILDGANITKIEEAKKAELVTAMGESGAESIEDLKLLSKTEISAIFKLPPVQTTKIFNFIKEFGNVSEEVETEFELPSLPENFGAFQGIVITGNKEISPEMVNNFIEFGLLYGMGVEDLGKSLIQLLRSRMEDLDVPASEKVVKAYKLVAKFETFDTRLAAALDFELSMLSSRHEMANTITNSMTPDIVSFINDALDFRLELSDFNTLVLQRVTKAKVGSEVSGELLLTSIEELAIRISRHLRGLNSLIVKESLVLYKDLFELINDTDLQKFLGVQDSKDLLNRLGATITPKEVKAFEKVPELVYQILYVMQNQSILNNEKNLAKYLQNVWANAKVIDWAKLGSLNMKKSGTSQTTAKGIVGLED